MSGRLEQPADGRTEHDRAAELLPWLVNGSAEPGGYWKRTPPVPHGPRRRASAWSWARSGSCTVTGRFAVPSRSKWEARR